MFVIFIFCIVHLIKWVKSYSTLFRSYVSKFVNLSFCFLGFFCFLFWLEACWIAHRCSKMGIIRKCVKQFQTVITESICSEVTISGKKWFCVGIYRPPNFNNLDTFFKKVSDPYAKQAWPTNILILWNFIINTKSLLKYQYQHCWNGKW